jgi:hypothetical protein
MKRIIATALALAFVVSIGYAQTANKATKQDTPTGKTQRGALFVDKDGDGVCDNFGTKAGQKAGMQKRNGKGYGPGDGTGNQGNGPKDGTGFGAGKGTGTGTGNCDGTGPKGNRGGQK